MVSKHDSKIALILMLTCFMMPSGCNTKIDINDDSIGDPIDNRLDVLNYRPLDIEYDIIENSCHVDMDHDDRDYHNYIDEKDIFDNASTLAEYPIKAPIYIPLEYQPYLGKRPYNKSSNQQVSKKSASLIKLISPSQAAKPLSSLLCRTL